jgi:hypothetical protein
MRGLSRHRVCAAPRTASRKVWKRYEASVGPAAASGWNCTEKKGLSTAAAQKQQKVVREGGRRKGGRKEG